MNTDQQPIEGVNKTVINTAGDAKDGQDKCSTCGATDIAYSIEKGVLQCRFCRANQKIETFDLVNASIDDLDGTHIGSGADDIQDGVESVITLKCQSCAAEVVINTEESMQARCHWCRNTLSINEQIPNGAVPDMVLPFAITKEEGKAALDAFVGGRKFFAHPKFKREFSSDNIFGVYLPYMTIDMKVGASMSGEGEIETDRYTVTTGTGKNKQRTTYYDADAYTVERQFDLNINDLSIEGSSDKLDTKSKSETNNVINAVMPFDVENSLKWNANYLKGFRSEKRDVNIEQLRPLVEKQARDIARFKANDTITQYDRGVKWENDSIEVKGERWLSAYFPVWLYSYQQTKGEKNLLHYTAVNARTKETMGSIPINKPKLLFVSLLVGALCYVVSLFINVEYDWLLSLGGAGYYYFIYSRYRNAGERHYHEKHTEAEMKNVIRTDNFLESRKRMRNSKIKDQNNNSNIS